MKAYSIISIRVQSKKFSPKLPKKVPKRVQVTLSPPQHKLIRVSEANKVTISSHIYESPRRHLNSSETFKKN